MGIVLTLFTLTVAFATWTLTQLEATASSPTTTPIDTTFWGVILIAGLGVLGWVLTQAVRLSQVTTRLESRLEGVESRHTAAVKNDEILFGLVRDLQSQVSTERVENAAMRARFSMHPHRDEHQPSTTTLTTTFPTSAHPVDNG